MKNQMKNRLLCALLASGLAFGSTCIPAGMPQSVQAAEQADAEWQTAKVYKGSNVEDQNYSVWSSPIQSYLVEELAGNNYMRIQCGRQIDGILAEYYDRDFQLQAEVMIPEELPIFGGFYKTDDAYFILSGQENPGESADVEVFRITKYDKDWNRIGSAGLKDCNTTIPFDAGCPRMDAAGKYLLIHTSHEMYKSSDGRNHQANVTIQLDMENMKITDSYTDVMNSRVGYVSHSFNQFIKVDNNRIVTVDHGDAYPRSVALLQYQTNVSDGQFVPNYFSTPCNLANVLEFSGQIGQNSTGASVGGFELSASSYVVAGNSIEPGTEISSSAVRNVFVAAVNKSSGSVKLNWLTQNTANSKTASTPHMAAIGNDRFLILWSVDGMVYYTTVDADVERTDRIYEMKGNLSDCAPLVSDGKLVWYTWDNEQLNFYEIRLNDLSQNRVKAIVNGEKKTDSEKTDDKDTDKQENKKAASVGTKLTDKKSGAVYQVTKSGTSGARVNYLKQTGNGSSVTIPASVTLDGITYRVTGIAPNAFQNNKKLTKVTIGNNVLTIGKQAFSGCTKLKQVSIGKNVATIADRAFSKCSALTGITIPAKVTKIGTRAFYKDKKLKTVTVKTQKLAGTSIGKQAFSGIDSKAAFQFPSGKKAAYKKLFRAGGANL